jgi:hypothetical protein
VKHLLTLALLIFAYIVLAQETRSQTNGKTRELRGQTIISKTLPRAELTLASEFHYVGRQQVYLYGNAEAEQYVFAKAGKSGAVEKFYWVQFEHFLPTNSRTYHYPTDRSTTIGAINFVYDVKSWSDYAALQSEDPQSDGAAIARLLAKNGLSFPKRAVRVRMFHLPAPDHRSELMIIYGESLPDASKLPVRQAGVELDKESPEAARIFLDHARANLSIREQ